jgi:hypothetical protein
MTPKPFKSAEHAFFWFMRSLESEKHTGLFGQQRPCEPQDIRRAIERLVRGGFISPQQVTVLRTYGLQGRSPEAGKDEQKHDSKLWNAAMKTLRDELAGKGIVKREERYVGAKI